MNPVILEIRAAAVLFELDFDQAQCLLLEVADGRVPRVASDAVEVDVPLKTHVATCRFSLRAARLAVEICPSVFDPAFRNSLPKPGETS